MTVPDLIKVIHLQFQVPVQGGNTFSQIAFCIHEMQISVCAAAGGMSKSVK